MTTIDLIVRHGLLVRPALFGDGWRAGQFRSITGHPMPQAFSHDGTEWEAETLEEAVQTCVDALAAGRLNPQWQALAKDNA